MGHELPDKGGFFVTGLGVCHGLIIFTFLFISWIIGLSLFDTLFGIKTASVIGLTAVGIGALTIIGTKYVLCPIRRTIQRHRNKLSDKQRSRMYRRLYRS